MVVVQSEEAPGLELKRWVGHLCRIAWLGFSMVFFWLAPLAFDGGFPVYDGSSVMALSWQCLGLSW